MQTKPADRHTNQLWRGGYACPSNPPTLAPRPYFTNLCALHLCLQWALHWLVNPQSNVLGWSGLVISWPMYALLSRNLFPVPNGPGPIPVCYGPGTPIVNTDGSPVIATPGIGHFKPAPWLIAPCRLRSTCALSEQETSGYHTKTSNEHVTTCSTGLSMMQSSFPLILISQDVSCWWQMRPSWTNSPWHMAAQIPMHYYRMTHTSKACILQTTHSKSYPQNWVLLTLFHPVWNAFLPGFDIFCEKGSTICPTDEIICFLVWFKYYWNQ